MKGISNLKQMLLMLLYICSPLRTSLLNAETSKKNSTLTGTLKVSPKTTDSYTLFIILSKSNQQPIEAQKNPPLPSGAPSESEVLNPYILNLGPFNKTTHNYSITVPQGTWFLTALLKKKQEECPSYTIKSQSIIKKCEPGKDDIVCESYSLEIKDNKMSAPLIECNTKL